MGGWLTRLTEPRDRKSHDGSASGGQPIAGGDAFPAWAGMDSFGGLVAPGDARYPEPNFINFAHAGWSKNEIVYACIMKKASSLPDAPLRVFAGGDSGLVIGTGGGAPIEDHPLRKLISHPNPVLTEFELWELTVMHLDLAGNAFWEIVRDRVGRVVELWPLRPDLVRIHPQKSGKPTYSYVIGDGRAVPLGGDVVQFRHPNPGDPILGQPPMRPALRAVSLDNEATDFVKALLQNKAVPGAVIETEQRLDEELTKRLTAKWKERFGGKRRGEPAFLQKGMKVHALGLTLEQLEFPDLRAIAETRICGAFGVPPILIGAKAGLDRSTFSNYREARASFWEETLMPIQRRMQETIKHLLLPKLQTGVRPRRVEVHFDNSQVLALRESEGKRWELATAALRAGGITVNQFNTYIGLPRAEGGDIYLRPAGVVPTLADGTPAPGWEGNRLPKPADDHDENRDEREE